MDDFIDYIHIKRPNKSVSTEALSSLTNAPNNEPQGAVLLNSLCDMVYQYTTIKMEARKRTWPSTHIKPLPDQDAIYRPDPICVDDGVILDARLIRTVIELRSRMDSESSIHRLCAERASDIFRVQDVRFFVLVCALILLGGPPW